MNDTAVKKKRRWGRILFKFFLVLLVTLIIALFVLAKIGGDNPSLRDGLEEFLSQVTGERAVIGELVYMGFVPNVRVDANSIIIQKAGDPTNILASIGHADFSQPTWHYVLGRNTVEKFSLEGLSINAGVFGDQDLKINSLSIQDLNESTPMMVADGAIGEVYAELELGMEALSHNDGRILYRLPDRALINLALGDLSLKGFLNALKPGTQLSDIKVSVKDQDVLTGQADIDIHGSQFLNGTLNAGQSELNIKINVTRYEDADNDMSLEIKSSDFYADDLKKLETVKTDLSVIPLAAILKPYNFGGQFSIERYHENAKTINNVQGDIELKDGTLQFMPRCDEALTQTALCAQ